MRRAGKYLYSTKGQFCVRSARNCPFVRRKGKLRETGKRLRSTKRPVSFRGWRLCRQPRGGKLSAPRIFRAARPFLFCLRPNSRLRRRPAKSASPVPSRLFVIQNKNSRTHKHKRNDQIQGGNAVLLRKQQIGKQNAHNGGHKTVNSDPGNRVVFQEHAPNGICRCGEER